MSSSSDTSSSNNNHTNNNNNNNSSSSSNKEEEDDHGMEHGQEGGEEDKEMQQENKDSEKQEQEQDGEDEKDEGVKDDEDEDDEDEEEEHICEQQMAQLQAEIESNPYDYEKRMELIRLLRANGELDLLRKLREDTSAIFAMPSKFWLDWIEDEKSCDVEREVIESLFERAINDFHSPDLIIEYVQWACGVSIEFARKKMQQAVTLIGLRADCASIIWNVWLDFEKMILASLEQSTVKCSPQKSQQQQHDRVDDIYKRFLHIPHMRIEETWNDYREFAGDQQSTMAKRNYEEALKRMPLIVTYEDRLDDDTLTITQQLSILSEYIDMEMQARTGADPARIQMLFERALVASATEPNVNLWLQYGAWLDASLRIPSVAVSVYERAIRHAGCASIYQQYLSALERAQYAPDIIDAKWQLAKQTIQSADEGLSLYRTYIYLLRRRANAQGEDYTKVLELFEEGITFLQEKFGAHWDSPKAQYRKNYALFLYTMAKQPDKGRKVWNDILASGSGHLAAAWLEATNLERFFGKTESARKLLYRAINSTSDHPYTVYEALIQFEREVGTLEQLDKALEKVNAQAARVAARAPKKRDEQEKSKLRSKKAGDGSLDELVSKEEKKSAGTIEKSESGAGREKKSPQKRSREQESAQTANANGHLEETEAKKTKTLVDEDGFTIPTMRAPRTNGDSGGGISDGLVSASASSSSSSTSKTGGGDQETKTELSKTVFISNLDFKLSKERIQEVFPNAKEVRFIQRGMSKLHKGFGYVDFETPEEAKEALSKDRTLIDGRPMYVSENRPHPRGERSEFRYPTNLEKNKLFIGNVHYDATAEQLRELFAVFGKIQDVRIVTHKSGKSKGCAYLEFEDEQSASAAIQSAAQSDHLVLLERKLSVAISNPPKKTQHQTTTTPKTLSAIMAHQRSKIDLIPRSISRSAKSVMSDSTVDGEKKSTKKNENGNMNMNDDGDHKMDDDDADGQQQHSKRQLSNEQFRSMFSK